MTICLVSQEYPPETALGGIGTQNWNKARALARLGHTVHVLSAGVHSGTDCRVSSHDGVTVHRIAPPEAYAGGTYNQASYLLGYSWLVLCYLRRLTQSVRFDVIDFAEYGAEGYVFQLERTAEWYLPVVVQLHGPLALFAERIGWPEKQTDFFRLGSFLEGDCIRHADALMACSRNIADFTSDYYGVPRQAIDVVHCGVDAEAFHAPEPEELPQRPTVLFAGNLTYSKGLKTAIDAVLRLRAKHPGIVLRIVGKGPAETVRELRSLARAEKAGGAIEVAGFLDRAEMAAAFRRAHVFCSPAVHEPGVANVYIEAMASGCPVVACNSGGAPEAVVDGVNGILVPRQDTQATAAAIDRIVCDADLRLQFSRAGRLSVENYFAMDHYIGRVLSVYQQAIRRARERFAPVLAEVTA